MAETITLELATAISCSIFTARGSEANRFGGNKTKQKNNKT